MMTTVSITDYSTPHLAAIRRILERIGWEEQYIVAAEQNAKDFSQNREVYGVYIATLDGSVVGFIYVQFYEWNRLAQIQGLAVDLSYQRQGIAAELVKNAERFARDKGARGMYVDTPTLNRKGRDFYEAIGYGYGYDMPRYYEDALDGVTYQKFFDSRMFQADHEYRQFSF
jgi:ribosomal protein S18 acetylase RimI-like enzyme